MERVSRTLGNMIIIRFLLFCGAAWSVVRFSFFYFSLSAGLNPRGDVFTGLLLFSFGSAHAVMAAGYIMTGVFLRSYRAVIKLLAAGQMFAVCGDLALLAAGTGLFGPLDMDFRAFPSLAAAAGITAVDTFFMAVLLLQRDKPAASDGGNAAGPDDTMLPEVPEVSLEEE